MTAWGAGPAEAVFRSKEEHLSHAALVCVRRGVEKRVAAEVTWPGKATSASTGSRPQRYWRLIEPLKTPRTDRAEGIVCTRAPSRCAEESGGGIDAIRQPFDHPRDEMCVVGDGELRVMVEHPLKEGGPGPGAPHHEEIRRGVRSLRHQILPVSESLACCTMLAIVSGQRGSWRLKKLTATLRMAPA